MSRRPTQSVFWKHWPRLPNDRAPYDGPPSPSRFSGRPARRPVVPAVIAGRLQIGLWIFGLIILPSAVSICLAQQGPPAPAADSIPKSEIVALQKELAEQAQATSSISRRRVCKSTVRKAEALLDKSPDAPNRFRVLEIILQSQKRLLQLETSGRNRDALFETCEQLAQAPDEYAEIRLEADMLLSERALALAGADVKERARALAEVIRRYRDTPGEAKSLMMAALIAPKLNAFELKQTILDTMNERFAGDPTVIGWRRKYLGISQLDVLFTGTYVRADGTSLTFPIDTMGHTCLMYFWSKHTPDIETHLAAVKEMQSRHPDQVDVYSFNVDELPDAGEKMLRSLGLDWTAMHLPGGRESEAYRAYATMDPIGIRVNAHGHAFVRPTAITSLIEQMPPEQDFDDARYLAQLQSLLIGDFLVNETDSAKEPAGTAESIPEETLEAIQSCFTYGPKRYRQSGEQTLANYAKAEQLCRDAIKQYPEAPDLWRVRNRRIIALLGMWNVATEPKHLEEAAAEARTALTGTLPQGADVVPRFCLAKEAIRQGERQPSSVLSALIEQTGGPDAPALAHAAAAVLAMDVNLRELHEEHRRILLETKGDDPMAWPVVSFLRDQNHRFRLFEANYYHPPSRARRVVRATLRRNAATVDIGAEADALLKTQLRTLDGGKLTFPRATDGKLTLVMFVEPPADPDAEFPTVINGTVTEDSRGRDREVPGVMQRAFQLADEHVSKGIKVIAAFVCDDVERVKERMAETKWPCQAAIVPGGLDSPLVRQLGILWPDRVPNIALLGPDGKVAWRLSGIVHPQLRSEGVGELMHVITLGMRANIQVLEMECSIAALRRGEFKEAVRLFSGPFPLPTGRNADGWIAPRRHGRALAHMGLKDWEAALADLDAAIEAHEIVFNYGRSCNCQCVAGMLRTKATALEQTGQPDEADAARKRAEAATSSHGTSRYNVFHDQLEAIKTKIGP